MDATATRRAKIRTDPAGSQFRPGGQGARNHLVIDRDQARGSGSPRARSTTTLYDAFGQRQVSTIYRSLNNITW